VSTYTDAHLIVFAADYVGADSTGKLSAFGLGFQIAGFGGSLGQEPAAAPQHVALQATFPAKHAGTDVSLSLTLHDDTNGSIVQVPSFSGAPDSLRIQQVCRLERPSAPGVYLPSEMPIRINMQVAFPAGLPLRPGQFYSWRAEVDGQGRKDWRASFYTAGPPPLPVIGGSAGPASIPNMPHFDEPSDG